MNTSRKSWRRLAVAALLGLAALAGCGGSDGGGGGSNGPAAVVIGSAGGTVTGPDGVTVDVPAGALAVDTTLQITAANAPSVLPLPPGIAASDKVYNFLPHGTVFSVPARLSIPRLASEPATGMSILKTNLPGNAWEQLATSTSTSAHSALITSFSSGRMMCGGCVPPLPPPVITVQPISGSVDEGGYVLLDVAAIGMQPLTYQWLTGGGPISGERSSAIVINPITRADDGTRLFVVVTDALGRSTTSDVAVITVRAGVPVIQTHPSSQTVTAGTTATFFASSTSSVAQDLQWERYNATSSTWDVVATQTAQLVLPNVQVAADDQARFRFGARNTGTMASFVYSNVATLTVRSADTQVVITQQPLDVGTIGGRSASFQVFASGTNLTYEWWRSDFGGPFFSLGSAGGTSATLTISNPTRGNDGARFFVIVGNSLGSVQSNTVTLGVASMNEALTTRLAGGSAHSMFLADDGRLFAWGANDFGELGTGAFTSFEPPAPVTGLPPIATFASGSEHALAVDSNGTVYAWGWNGAANLGDGTTTDRTRPITVDLGGAPARFVSAGLAHSVAGTGAFSFLSWGTAYHGDGSYHVLPLPTPITPAFVALSSRSSDLSVGLRADGTVWTWGVNGEGGLGTGDLRARLVPQPIGGVAQIVSVAAGDEHAMALRNDGTVFAWGRNSEGQLGIGSTTRSLVPVAVPLPGIAIAIAVGNQHSLALLSDGRLFAWGSNAVGAIGNGTNLDATSPVLVNAPFLGPIQNIGAGERHSLALDALGVVWAWGDNASMQLGDGTRTARNRPVVVLGLPVN